MQVYRLAWLGARTERYDAMVRFYRDVLHLSLVHQEPDFTVFCLPNGDNVEVFRSSLQGKEHFTTGPVVGFLVDDIEEGARELEAAGVELLSPVQWWSDTEASVHFRAPDGNVYELTYADTTPSPGEMTSVQ